MPFIEAHLAALQAQTVQIASVADKDMIDAVAFIRRRLGTLFSSL